MPLRRRRARNVGSGLLGVLRRGWRLTRLCTRRATTATRRAGRAAAGRADADPDPAPSPPPLGPPPLGVGAGLVPAGPVGSRLRGPRMTLARFTGRGWMLWRAPRAVTRRVLVVDLCWLGLIGLAVTRLRPRWSDLVVCAVFILLGALAVAASGRLGDGLALPRTRRHDLLSTWSLAAAVLLPPLYPALVGVPLCWLAGRRDPVQPPHLRLFHAAALGIAGLGASAVHQLLSPTVGPFTVETLVGSGSAALSLLAAVGVYPIVARLPRVGLVRSGGDESLGSWVGEAPAPRWGLVNRDLLPAQAAEICSSIVVAVLWAANPLLMVAVIPPVLLLQRSLLHAELLHAARSDAKTRLANPAYWRQVAEREIGRAGRAGRPLSVLLVDIDNFKRVNDRFGHLIGDVILVAVADALRAVARPRDLVGRFGGEEFVVLLAEAELDNAAAVAERIRRQVAETPCRLEGRPPLSVTVSVGVATHHGPSGDLSELLERADLALYRAKADGRNLVRLAGPVYTPA